MIKPFGKVRPGTRFLYQGREYMKQKGSFATPMWEGSGLFTDAVNLSKTELVEVTDESGALTREQERET